MIKDRIMTKGKYIAATVTLVFTLGSWAGISIINNRVDLAKLFTKQKSFKEDVGEIKTDIKDLKKEIKAEFKEFRNVLEDIDDKIDKI